MDSLTITRSLDRILQISGKKYKLYAEDWISDYQAEEAASVCAVAVNRANADGTGNFNVDLPTLGEMLGTLARVKLGVDDDRPYGFAVVVEPIAAG